MANDVKTKHPLDKYLRPLKVDDKNSALETAESGVGAKVKGDLEVTGQIDTVRTNRIEASKDLTIAGAENIVLDAAGDVYLDTGGYDLYFATQGTNLFHFDITNNKTKVLSQGDPDDYLEFEVGVHGSSFIRTVNDSADIASLTLEPEGALALKPGSNLGVQITPDTKDASSTNQSSLSVTETLNLGSGEAGGSDVHYGIKYTQTQTDIAGWNNVYLMHLNGGTNKVFAVDSNGHLTAGSVDGKILGYTDIGLNEAHASQNLTTSFVVPTDEFSVSFTAPPSGNVMISFQVQFTHGSSGLGNLYAGLSTANATSGYSALATYHEKVFEDVGARNGINTVYGEWTLTGLTAGDDYEYWAGFKSSSTTGTPKLRWGANASGRYPDFIMKAIALPATMTT